MKMDIAVRVICFLCCLSYGYSSTNDAENVTLVLSNITCHENNNKSDISFNFEPVSYGEVLGLENQILELLTNGDSVRLADYGVIRSHTLKCYKLIEKTENKKRITEIKNSIISAYKDPEQSLQNVLKTESALIGYSPSMCVFVPLRTTDLISCFEEAENRTCDRNGNTNITTESSEIYMYMFAPEFGHNIKSSHVLCNYVNMKVKIKKNSNDIDYMDYGVVLRYSHCGLPIDATLCYSDDKNCETIDLLNMFFKKRVCLTYRRPGCWYRVCPDRYFAVEHFSTLPISDYIPEDFFKDLEDYIFYTDRQKLTLLDVYKETNTDTMCISLGRYANGLFVNTTKCNTAVKFICKKIPLGNTLLNTTIHTVPDIENITNNTDITNETFAGNLETKDSVMSVTLISVGVSLVFILATVLVFVKVRRYFRRNSGTTTIEMQLRSGQVLGHVPDTFSVSRHAGSVDGDSHSDSVTGRNGTDNDDSDSYTGSVTGRSGTVGDDSYGGSVPGRGGTVDDDSYGGEVHGRTASGRINLYPKH